MEIDVPERFSVLGLGRAYRVFDNRASLVAQVNSIEEAEEEVKRFPG